jgi:ATP-dependent Clp protease ATP-binding subunit ClpB
VDLQLADVSKRLSAKRIRISFTDGLKKFIAEKGYDPSFGARPLKRAIQEHVLDGLAMSIISGEISEGDDVKIDARKSGVSIKKIKSPKRDGS